MQARMVYVTCQDREQAVSIGKVIVEERLAACANILAGMTSLYWWEGKVVSDQECVLILKTTTERMPLLTERVTALHSYEVPCVVSLPLLEGNTDYLSWIEQETQAHHGDSNS